MVDMNEALAEAQRSQKFLRDKGITQREIDTGMQYIVAVQLMVLKELGQMAPARTAMVSASIDALGHAFAIEQCGSAQFTKQSKEYQVSALAYVETMRHAADRIEAVVLAAQ
jgi:hypothetical protein